MSTPLRFGVVVLAATAVAAGVAGCRSQTTPAASSTTSAPAAASATSSVAAPASPAAPAPAPITTLADYIAANGIVETPVAEGDAGSPTINLPPPQGWTEMESGLPDGAYSGMTFTGNPENAKNPPTIITKVVKLTGNADPAKVLEAAPGEVRKYPGFQGPPTGQSGKLSGFAATVIGGTYTRDGISRLIAQKTVVIPGSDGLFVFQMTADGTEDEAYPLMDATAAIDKTTTITP